MSVEFQASKSDIDFDFDDDSGSDVSIATDASSVVRSFGQAVGLNERFPDDSDGASGASISDDDDIGDPKRRRGSSVDSDDFGPPIVVPLKPGSDHDGNGDINEPIPPGSRSSRGSRRSMPRSTIRSGSFSRRPPVRTKSGEGGMIGSIHSTTSASFGSGSFRRRPPVRTKSGEGIVAGENGEEGANAGEDNREIRLKRNMAQRQRSSDTLAEMKNATRNLNRSQSGVSGISNGRRRLPDRSRSTDVTGLSARSIDEISSPGRRPLRRKPPARTKSGSAPAIAAPELPLET